MNGNEVSTWEMLLSSFLIIYAAVAYFRAWPGEEKREKMQEAIFLALIAHLVVMT